MTIQKFICLSVVLLLGTLITPAQGSEPRLVKVGAFNYYPGIFKDHDGQIKGFYVDALADLAAKENLQIEYVYGSWSEGLERIKTGEVDVLTSVAHTPERASYMNYTETPLLTVWGELYVHPDTHLDTITEAEGKKIAVMKGDYNGQHFIELTRKFNISCTFVELPGFEEVFKAIAEKRVDGGVVNNTFGVPKQREYGLRSTGVVFNPLNIYFTVSKLKNQDLLIILEKHLHGWRHDKNSVYALARQKWGHISLSSQTIPAWLKNTAIILSLLVVTTTGFILLLRNRVRQRTNELLAQKANLRESVEMTHLLLDSTAEGIYRLDLNGNCTLCNAAGLKLLGYPQQDQLLGKNMHELIHHTHADGSLYENTDCPIIRSFSSGEKIHCAAELFWRADGSSFPVEYWSYPIIKEGIVIGAVVTFLDISERLLSEQSLLESETRYRSIFENSRSVMLIIDPESTAIVDANPAATAFYGGTREEFCQLSITHINLLKPEQVAAEIRQADQQNRNYFHFKHRLKTGETRDVEVFSGPIQSKGKQLLFSIIHDITERRKAEDALLENEARYRALIESAPLPIMVNLHGHFVLFNKACLALFDAKEVSQLLGKTPLELFHHDCHDQVHERIQQLLTEPTAVPTIEETIVRLDGRPIEVEVTAASFQTGDDISIHVILQDITARKQAEQSHRLLEEQLRHAQRMEAIGTLAGGIAHDFNNILTAIIGYAHISQMGLSADAPQRAHIQQISECANRATRLTRDLLVFSRKQAVSKKQTNLAEIICNTTSFLERIIGETIQLVTELPTQPITINADPHQLDQVFMNLASNARDAMPAGGTITIRVTHDYLDAAAAAAQGLSTAGHYAVLQFSDTGQGIAQEYLDKIFDPFFTTKEVGQGTGLGLPIAYGIITGHDGCIRASSTPGIGTTFTIHLPCALQNATDDNLNHASDEPLPRGNLETILVAEDAERIRDMACQVLTEAGYTVLPAVDGEDAVTTFRQHSDQIRLLLFDLVMPNKGGFEAYQEINALQPGIPVIFSTGYAPEIATGKLSQQQLAQVLHKPFSIVQLLKAVRTALDAHKDQT